MEQLRDATAVITGAGSGIGRALTVACAAEGMRVAAADIEVEALAATLALVVDTGVDAIAVETDVADAGSVRALAARVDAELGGADLLCNNAGVFAGGTLWTEPVADFTWVMGVNFYGILHGIQAFVPGMLERGRPGHIVNTISAAGIFPSAYSAAYTTSKFAGLALTECLAGELAGAGAPIGVTALCPGAVHTGIASSARNRTDGASSDTPDAARDLVDQALSDLTERGRPPSEVAAIVLDAVRTGRYLQLTHDGYVGALRTRTDELLGGGLPTLPYFD
jgi:NAD(P)-dependent dehydrogenase (short-subunit alcohol dehydrogenase family)